MEAAVSLLLKERNRVNDLAKVTDPVEINREDKPIFHSPKRNQTFLPHPFHVSLLLKKPAFFANHEELQERAHLDLYPPLLLHPVLSLNFTPNTLVDLPQYLHLHLLLLVQVFGRYLGTINHQNLPR